MKPYLAAAGREGRLSDGGHPETWDAFYDFFKEVQKKWRAQGMRHVYGLGFQLNTAGNDSNARANDS